MTPPRNQLHRDELHTTRQNLSDEHSVLDRPPPPHRTRSYMPCLDYY